MKSRILALLLLTTLAGVFPATAQETCEAGFRLIEDYFGEVCIPENPQRVTVIDQGVTLEHFVALSVQPISAPMSNTMAHYVRSGLSADVIDHGTTGEPNLEVILAAQPDLIIGWNAWITEELHAALSAIAPTVATPRTSFYDWKEDLIYVADVLGVPEKAEEVLAAYDERAQSLGEALGTEPVTVTNIATWGDNIRLEAAESFSNVILDDVGIQRPQSQVDFITEHPDKWAWGELDLSIEEIRTADADHIFFMSYSAEPGDEAAVTEAALLNNPLWQQLEAVQNEQVYMVVGDVWLQGSVMGAHLILDDLAAHLLDTELAIPNPFLSVETEATPEETEEASS